MKKYDLALFDLDGTILDTSEGVLSAVKHTIEKKGYPMLTDEQLAAFIGPPIQDSFAKAFGLSGDILQELAAIFRDQYKDVDLLKAAPYEGIYEMFQGLLDGGVIPAVATYKREDYAITLLKHYKFDQYAKIMHGSDLEQKLKKKDIMELSIAEAGITDYSRVVMIGDTMHDANGAKELGVDFIGVTYGFGFKKKEDLDGVPAIGCVDRAIDLLSYIC